MSETRVKRHEIERQKRETREREKGKVRTRKGQKYIYEKEGNRKKKDKNR